MVLHPPHHRRFLYVPSLQSHTPHSLYHSITPIYTNNHAVEIIGFTGRILSHNDLWALGPFIMQSLLILIAPALFAASIYIILGRIILLVDGEEYSLVRRKWLTKVFVVGDVLSFMMQGAGTLGFPPF
jgi:hypothetical protein